MARQPIVCGVTGRVSERGRARRQRYLDVIAAERERHGARPRLGWANRAEGYALRIESIDMAGQDK